jgi:hypothetical protein
VSPSCLCRVRTSFGSTDSAAIGSDSRSKTRRSWNVLHYVSVENVEAGIPSGPAIGIDVTSVLLETWCTHELQWVVYERNTSPVWAQVVRHLRGYFGYL